MEAVLAIATILGGVAAVWYFWDKLLADRSPGQVPPATPDSVPGEKWVDSNYPCDSGLQARLQKLGFKIVWCFDTQLARKLDLEGWEIVVEPDARDVISKYRLKDRPSDQTLIKKRLS